MKLKGKVEATARSSPRQKKQSHLSEGYFGKKDDCHKQLRPLQKRAVEFCCEREASALLFKQRLGKTYIAAGVVEKLSPQRTLIVVPLTNKQSTWTKKLAELVPHIPVVCPTARGRKPLLAALQAFEAGVFLLHFEAFCSIAKQLRKRDWDLIIVDEAHRAKDRASLFSRRLAMLRDNIARKILLTGTPIEDYPQDMWGQMRFLAPDVLGVRYKDFDEEFMLQAPPIPKELFKSKGSVRLKKALLRQRIIKKRLGFNFDKLQDLIDRLKPYCWREELPGAKPTFHYVWVKSRGYERKTYDTLKKKGVVRLRDGALILPPIEIAKRVKLRQITSGFVYDEDKEVHWVGRTKLREVLHLMQRVPKPVVIFSLYIPEIERLLEELPGRGDVLYGATPRQERPKVQERFQAGKLDWLLCQTRTGGVGIDLFRARSMIVVSSNYSSIDFDQLISRIQLPNQTEPKDIFLVLTMGTIDEDRQDVVFRKNRRVHKVVSQLRRTE